MKVGRARTRARELGILVSLVLVLLCHVEDGDGDGDAIHHDSLRKVSKQSVRSARVSGHCPSPA